MATTGEHERPATEMVERGDVLDALERVLDDASQGQGGALFVIGPAGLGKTTVLEHAITVARPQFTIGVGRGDRMEAVLPFGLLGQALDQLLEGRLPPGMTLDAGDGDATDITAQSRLYRILRGVREAAVRPLLVALDDLHWSDPDSLIAIHLICRRLASLPVALIATIRPWPAEAVTSAQDLAAQGLAKVERLAPLSSIATRELLRSRLGELTPVNQMDRAIDLCGGNPLLAEQLALELRRSGRLLERQVWFSRFVGVGAAGRRYMQAASVLGTRFRIAVATEVAGLPGTDAAAEIDRLFRGGLLYEAGDGWARFAHALIQQELYEDIAPPVRRKLHAACFRALVALGAHPAEATKHAVAAQLAGDRGAVTTVARAGRDALRVGAVRAAHRHLTAAVALAGESAPADLLFDFGAALVVTGARAEAAAVFERLLNLPELPTPDHVAVLRELGQASFVTGQVERAAACYESAVGLAEDDHPALAVGALLDQAFHHQWLFGPRAALPWANRAAELAVARGVMQASAQAAWGAVAYRCGDPAGLDTAAAAATRVDLTPTSRSMDRHRYRHPALSYATLAVHAERFADAERLLTEILSSAERRCEPLTLIQAAAAWIDGLCRLGRLNEASKLVERLVDLVELFPHGSRLASTYQALVLLERGCLEQAALCCAQLAATGHRDGRYSLHRTNGLQLHVRGVLAHRQGDVETARSLFAQLEQWADRTGEVDPAYVPWAAEAIAVHLACGRNSDARHVIDWVAQRAVSLPSRWPKIVVATGQAALAERARSRTLAETYFTHALELASELAMPLTRAQTLTDYGAFLNRGGEMARARVLLADAFNIAETCGAGWHATRARTEWRRAGGRTQARKPNELSPQEATVAQLAQSGRTNREIAQQLHLSIKTVETHLGHIYQKLGIRSRWQLTERTIQN